MASCTAASRQGSSVGLTALFHAKGVAPVPASWLHSRALSQAVQHPDRIIEAVDPADGNQSLTAADSPADAKGIEGRQGKLCLRERDLGLVA
jgi:hypothetical protein